MATDDRDIVARYLQGETEAVGTRGRLDLARGLALPAPARRPLGRRPPGCPPRGDPAAGSRGSSAASRACAPISGGWSAIPASTSSAPRASGSGRTSTAWTRETSPAAAHPSASPAEPRGQGPAAARPGTGTAGLPRDVAHDRGRPLLPGDERAAQGRGGHAAGARPALPGEGDSRARGACWEADRGSDVTLRSKNRLTVAGKANANDL